MIYKGKVFKFGNNINTDFIISGRYKFSITDMKILTEHLFEDIRPDFYREIKPKESILVAGYNFGMGSSREQAPLVIKEAGILCVVAESFARIFFRNAFNIGLSLIEADTDGIEEDDALEIFFKEGIIRNVTRSKEIKFCKWNKFQMELVKHNGIINYLEKHGGFRL